MISPFKFFKLEMWKVFAHILYGILSLKCKLPMLADSIVLNNDQKITSEVVIKLTKTFRILTREPLFDFSLACPYIT